MATYYVGSGGSDAAAGTSWGARWLTVGKALGAAGIASGDTVYLAPGTYRETIDVTLGANPTVETLIIGDVDGSHTSGVPGEVVLSAYTTNDTTAPSASILLRSGTFGSTRSFLTWRCVTFVTGSSTPSIQLTKGTTNWTFTDCTFLGLLGSELLYLLGAYNVPCHFLFDRCRMIVRAGVATIDLDTGVGADYDADILFRNCLMLSPLVGLSGACALDTQGTDAGHPGGVRFQNCTYMGQPTFFVVIDARGSTSIPCTVDNSIIAAATVGLSANTAGEIVETHNLFIGCTTPRTNVTAGTGSISDGSYAALFDIGQELVVGRYLRPFLTPSAGSPLLGFGAASSPPTVDLLNRPRPAGGQITNAVGALERHDTAIRESGTVDVAPSAISITGPGDHDFYIPVNDASTVITVRARYDTDHGTGTKPQAILLANPEIAVTTETKTMTAAVNTWETLTFTAIAPSALGVVTLRLVSRAAAATGNAFFDTVTVT